MTDINELVEQSVDGPETELRKIITQLQRQLAQEKDKRQMYFDAIHDSIEIAVAGITFPAVKQPDRDKRKKGEEFAIAVMSDWQLGKQTPTYDSDICADRVDLYAEKVIEIANLQRQDHPVKEIHLAMLGDMVEGELIFPGQAYEIDSSLFDQIVNGRNIMDRFVRDMAANFEQVHIHAVPGNHGYLGGRQRREMHKKSNSDRLLYTFCELGTRDLPNVHWNIAEDWWLIADLGDQCKFLLAHGNQVKGYQGIPWYGWTRKVLGWRSLEKIWPQFEFDHVLAGHFHTPVSIYTNGIRLWVNASTESHNPYALEQMAAAGEPAQWLLFGKKGKGLTAEYLVSLGT